MPGTCRRKSGINMEEEPRSAPSVSIRSKLPSFQGQTWLTRSTVNRCFEHHQKYEAGRAWRHCVLGLFGIRRWENLRQRNGGAGEGSDSQYHHIRHQSEHEIVGGRDKLDKQRRRRKEDKPVSGPAPGYETPEQGASQQTSNKPTRTQRWLAVPLEHDDQQPVLGGGEEGRRGEEIRLVEGSDFREAATRTSLALRPQGRRSKCVRACLGRTRTVHERGRTTGTIMTPRGCMGGRQTGSLAGKGSGGICRMEGGLVDEGPVQGKGNKSAFFDQTSSLHPTKHNRNHIWACRMGRIASATIATSCVVFFFTFHFSICLILIFQCWVWVWF